MFCKSSSLGYLVVLEILQVQWLQLVQEVLVDLKEIDEKSCKLFAWPTFAAMKSKSTADSVVWQETSFKKEIVALHEELMHHLGLQGIHWDHQVLCLRGSPDHLVLQ